MKVPLEVLELILLKCDGKTLLNAKKASELLSDTIEYLGKKSRLWEWCCKEEIPQDQLMEYIPLYMSHLVRKRWELIYLHWSSWEYFTPQISEPLLCPNNSFKRISSIAVSSHHIAVGSEDGRMKVYTSHWDPIFEMQIVAVRLTKLTFVGYLDYNDVIFKDICIVAAFHNGISIIFYNGIRKDQQDFFDVKSHSIYGNYICIEKVGGRMTIMEISKLETRERREVKEIWFTRIYSPRCITAYQMWNGKCSFLIDGTLSTVTYRKREITPMAQMKKVANGITFYAPLLLDSSTTHIIRNNVIINIYKNADKSFHSPDVIDNYVEIVILGGDKTYCTKQYNAWEIFMSDITCMYAFGNTFAIGTSCGTVYFYRINNWKNFDLKQYTCKAIVGKHPIIAIAAKETYKERRFYVSSRFAIHQIECWLPCMLQD